MPTITTAVPTAIGSVPALPAMDTIWLLVFSVVATATIGDAMPNTATSVVGWLEPQHFCGKELTKTLATLCDNQYATLGVRRDGNEKAINDQPLDSNSPYTYRSSPHHPDADAGGVDGQRSPIGRRRQRRETMYYLQGIIEECCLKPCSLRMLSSYCNFQVISTADNRQD